MRADRSMPSRASCASTWPPTSPGRAARHRPWAATRPRTIACAAAAEMTALRVPQRVGLVLSPDDGAAVAARVVVRFHLRTFVRVEPAARAGEVEPVHQLRVATRRLRAALRLFAPLLPARFAAAAHRDLAWLGGAIGAVRDLAPDLLRPHVRAVARAGRRLGPDAEAAELHRLRVRTKRLRYALETLRSLGDRSTRELLGRLGGLQDTLGKGQDAVMAIVWLRELAATRGAPASTLLPAGALIQALARRVQKQRRRALKAWRLLERTRLLDSVLKELAAAGSPPREAARA